MILVSAMPTLATTAVVLVGVGAASITFITLVNSTLQLTAAPEMRGRVVSLYTVALLGSIPIGGPIMGALAGAVGGRVALLIAGAVAVGTAAVGWRSLARVVVTRPGPASPRGRPGPRGTSDADTARRSTT